MATDSDHNTSEYEQLKETLELYPSIKITQVEGQPPDNYEIEYHLKGFVRNPDSSIAAAELHRIQITLPFGYPHFPPTVKPLTHIFHPDIDPAAIRIAEQWQAKPNLSDLVLTIGEMICGNIYSTEDAFNQEAADYYGEHQGELPLDVLQIADIDDSDERFDTLNEDTFSSLGLDDDDLFGTEPEENDSQTDLIRLQIEQKNFFAASQALSEIPASANIPDRDELEQSIASALKASDKLFKKVEQLEDKGQLEEAAKVIDEIEEVAADTPGLDSLRNRILQSLSLADTFSLETEGDDEDEQTPLQETEFPKSSPPLKPKASKAKVSTSSSVSLKFLLAAGILCIILIVGGLFYLKDKKILAQGQGDWEKALALTKNRQFDDAQAEAEAVLRALKNLNILRSSGKALSGEIATLLNSDDFQQGLLGNTLYEGVYVSFTKEKNLKELVRLTEQAELLVKQGKIRKSLPLYREALFYARKHDLTEQARELTQTINNLRFEDALAAAKKAENEKEWEDAADTYRRALELSRNLSDPKEAAEISKRLATATFRHELDRSKQAFTGAQWRETITMLEHAKALIEENPTAVSPRERAELDRLLLNSRLYQMLTLAREAYEVRDWEISINHYQAALRFLDTEKEGFGPGLEESIAKIEKTLLMMQIAQEQSKAVQAKKKEALDKVMEHYNTILRLISTSAFQNDENMRTLTANIREQRSEIQKQLDMQARINYLKENYMAIFTKNYPSFAGSKLQHPKATFNKKIGQKMLFTLTCVERSQGSSSRLELRYLYNPDTSRWSLYTGQ